MTPEMDAAYERLEAARVWAAEMEARGVGHQVAARDAVEHAEWEFLLEVDAFVTEAIR